MSKDLFPKKDTEITPTKRRILTDRQLLAINRDKVKKYYCEKWQNLYSLPYVIPPNSFMTVDKPISDALAKNYTVEMLCAGIDSFLQDKFQWYVENSHPIKYFCKDIPKWVTNGQRNKVKVEITKTESVNLQELNAKYGLLRVGNGWEDEQGRHYVDLESAIKAVTGGQKSGI